jgi:hypothetical protein
VFGTFLSAFFVSRRNNTLISDICDEITKYVFVPNITLFRLIAMLCGTDSIMWNIPHIQVECEEYFEENCQSHITLLWD